MALLLAEATRASCARASSQGGTFHQSLSPDGRLTRQSRQCAAIKTNLAALGGQSDMFCRILSAVILLAALQSPAVADEPPRRGGTLTIAAIGEPTTYDMHGAVSSAIVHRLAPHYSLLVKIDPAHYPNVVGDLADSWTVSPDGMTLQFKLHPGVHFHDGSILNSADVKATFERLRNPPTGVSSVRRELFVDIQSIDTPDNLTVVFKLSRPNPAMLQIIASPYNCIYSAKLLASDPDYPTKKVMGTGPFKFVSYVSGGQWIGERNNDYFRKGLPYLDGFTVVTATVPSQLNLLISGQVQTEFRGITPMERDRILGAIGDKVDILEGETPAMIRATFNATRPPLNDPRVRRALSLAIDRWAAEPVLSKISIFSKVGAFQRLGTEFARSEADLEKLPGFSRDIQKSREEAKRLLAEAGVHDLKLTFMGRPTFTNNSIYVIDQWRKIGVEVTLDNPEDSRFFTRLRSGEYDILLDSYGDFLDDPTVQMAVFKSFSKNPNNTSRIDDAKLDDLLDRQAHTVDVALRRKLVQELEAYVLEQGYSAPLFWGKRYISMPKSVHGFKLNPSPVIGLDLAEISVSDSTR
jgi:peptide/nickel transport system substrate-binding protein